MPWEKSPRNEPTELFRELREKIGDVLGSSGELYVTSLTGCYWILDGLRIYIVEPVFDSCIYLDLGFRRSNGEPPKVAPEQREKLERVIAIFRKSTRRSGRKHNIGCAGRSVPFKRRWSKRIVGDILELISK